MSPGVRKLLLTVHLLTSIGWIGIDAALLALGIIGLSTRNPETMRVAYVAVGLLGSVFIVPLSLGALVSGVLLSAGTRWGLLRHYWVAVTLVLTVAMTAAAIFALEPQLGEAAAAASGVPAGELTGADIGRVRFTLVIAPSVALLALSAVAAINVYKPWGMTSYGRRKAASCVPRARGGGVPTSDGPTGGVPTRGRPEGGP